MLLRQPEVVAERFENEEGSKRVDRAVTSTRENREQQT